MRTASPKAGKTERKAGPKLQLLRLRRWLSKAGLMSQSSSSLGTPGVLTVWGVCGPAGEPAFTAVEYGLEAGTEDVADSDEAWSLDAGRRQSRGSYGQFREMVVVNGMKKASNGTGVGEVMRRSRSLGLYTCQF